MSFLSDNVFPKIAKFTPIQQPSGLLNGAMWYDVDTNQFMGYVNGAVVQISGGGGSSAFASLTSGTNTTAAMVVGTGATLSATGSGTIAATSATTATTATSATTATTATTANAVAFSGITGATNTTAAMVIGTGGSLAVSGSGTIGATTLNGATFASPGAIGGTTAGSGAFTTLTASGQTTLSGAGAASVSPVYLNGTPFTSGTGTTNFPYLYLDFSVTKPTSFSTGGELFGINGPSGYLGNLMSLHVNGGAAVLAVSQTGAITTLSTISAVGVAQASKYQSSTNCSSSAAPAVCAAASIGTVVIAAAATSVTVNTTAVTANSEIVVFEDSSLGTKLGVTCNTTIARTYAVTARTAATSFVITTSAAPVTNPACLSYWVMN